MKKFIVVTGGCGFVGYNLIKYFLEKTNLKIISLDDYSSGTKKNHIKNKRVKYIFGHTKDINKTLIEIPEGERQDLRPVAYIRNGSIYACRRDMLVKGKRYGTKNSLAYIMDDNNSVNIDTKRDLLLAKILLKNKNEKF